MGRGEGAHLFYHVFCLVFFNFRYFKKGFFCSNSDIMLRRQALLGEPQKKLFSSGPATKRGKGKK